MVFSACIGCMTKFVSTKLPGWQEVCLSLAESRQRFELNGVETSEQLEFCTTICSSHGYSHQFTNPTTAVFEPIEDSPHF
jgi:hypothetical protein